MHGLRILMSGLTEKKTTIEQLMNIGSQQCFIISSRCNPVSEKKYYGHSSRPDTQAERHGRPGRLAIQTSHSYSLENLGYGS